MLIPSLINGAIDLLKDSPVENLMSAKTVVNTTAVSTELLMAEWILRKIPTKYRMGIFSFIALAAKLFSALARAIDEQGDKLIKPNIKTTEIK